MENILINDIFDELREENYERLLTENKVIFRFIREIQKMFIECLKFVCECNQRNNNHILIQSLEKLYKRCLDQKFQETNILSNNRN